MPQIPPDEVFHIRDVLEDAVEVASIERDVVRVRARRATRRERKSCSTSAIPTRILLSIKTHTSSDSRAGAIKQSRTRDTISFQSQHVTASWRNTGRWKAVLTAMVGLLCTQILPRSNLRYSRPPHSLRTGAIESNASPDLSR